jgi:hypothetical protein
LTLRLAKNYCETIDLIQVGLGEGMGATNLRLVYDALDQPTGQLPQGVEHQITIVFFPKLAVVGY